MHTYLRPPCVCQKNDFNKVNNLLGRSPLGWLVVIKLILFWVRLSYSSITVIGSQGTEIIVLQIS